jgi:putative aminopeptidase FrvX
MKENHATYMMDLMVRLLSTPSPTGMTEGVEDLVAKELAKLGIKCARARRGGISAWFGGPNGRRRAFGAHVDTLGAMVRSIRPNGALALSPIGSLPARFVEGARAIVHGKSEIRGTILSPKSSGHAHFGQVDHQTASWSTLEMRLDLDGEIGAGEPGPIRVGDFVSLDPQPEIFDNGFVVSRHLDNKAGAAALLTAAKIVLESKASPSHQIGLLFSASEETGGGPSHLITDTPDDFIAIDIGIVAECQNTHRKGVTICVMDSFGPYDRHLSNALVGMCKARAIPHSLDIFDNYFSDARSLRDAGLDTRLALICFGCESSHGYERTHIDSLKALVLLCVEAMTQP